MSDKEQSELNALKQKQYDYQNKSGVSGEKRIGEEPVEAQTVAETGEKEVGNGRVVQKEAEETHKETIHRKLKEQFGQKGVPQEQIDGAIALMEARAKSWASEEKGRNADDWYEKIADVKGGEFEAETNIKFQLGGNEVSGKTLPDVENGFYSPLEKRLLDTKVEKQSVNKWKTLLSGDEAKWTGLTDWLNSLKPDQTLSKTEIESWLKDNRVRVIEASMRVFIRK